MVKKEITVGNSRILLHPGTPPDLGDEILEREIPSNEAVVTALVVRVTEFLVKKDLIAERDRNRVGLSVAEALRNAVVHGNQQDFSKMVKLKVFVKNDRWSIRVDDDGNGFEPESVSILDTDDEDSIWGEQGRGIHLLSLYMDEVNYYRNGSTVVLTRLLK